MTASQQSSPRERVWMTAREYLTHWFTAGVILTLTGFTPDHWVERLFHALKLDGLRDSLPAVDYRLLVVGIGFAISTYALVFHSRRGRKEPLAAAMAPATTSAPGTAPAIEDLNDIAHKPSIAVLPFARNTSGFCRRTCCGGPSLAREKPWILQRVLSVFLAGSFGPIGKGRTP